MFALTDAFLRTEAPLTASVQMLPQTMQDVTIELVEGSASKAEAEVVRPPSAVPVQFRNQPRQQLETVPPVRRLMQDCPFPLLGLLRGKQFHYRLMATEQVSGRTETCTPRNRGCLWSSARGADGSSASCSHFSFTPTLNGRPLAFWQQLSPWSGCQQSYELKALRRNQPLFLVKITRNRI
jgi:hypothetical protein